jgi:hypothetical protein
MDMAGSSSGGSGSSWKPRQVAQEIRSAEREVQGKAFETSLSEYLSGLLGRFNDRDVPLVTRRLEEAKTALEGELESSFDQLFGGSVAKHTYVDGLSDVDCLMVINDAEHAAQGPQACLEDMATTLRNKLGDKAEITSGRLAVTVKYAEDGMELQLLPAVKVDDTLKIAAAKGDKWSEIDPKGFQEALTRHNDACGKKLVPTIKLAKAIVGQLPESQQLSGYHVESLAIDVFRNYKGHNTTAAMLPYFFEAAKDRVLRPIRDKTGQSYHVDDSLGDANSQERLSASHILGRIAKRMMNATAALSRDQWADLFGSEE